MPLPDCYPIRSPSPSPEEITKRKHFLFLVEGMDLPKHRVLNHDYEWIYAYGLDKNAAHPKIKKLEDFLKTNLPDNNACGLLKK
jgi:hypothetical protein